MFSVHETGRNPLKLWDSHAPFEPQAMQQLRNIAQLPFIHSHVAGMPDVHLGKGATVGSVIATKGAIVPAAVGVDIGCGMMARRLSLTADQLPDNMDTIRSEIERAVPHGRSNNGGEGDRGAWGNVPAMVNSRFGTHAITAPLRDGLHKIVEKHPKLERAAKRARIHLGTLGTGNHFIEVCLDEEQRVWVMLHSGSRGIGNAIGQHFMEAAKREMERYHIGHYLPDKDLSYLVEHTEIFDDYIEAMSWAQDYAMTNREIMMDRTLQVMRKLLPSFQTDKEAINCHHNYATRENHFGANVWVTRKGAVRAREGDLGIIPGSMGTGSFIVRGLGNRESFCSCSHGAGRTMSRNQAKKLISMEEHVEAMKGISARTDADVIDESPRAYKDIGAVMDAQNDLVAIEHRLRQILNVKG